jgi:aminoglycoside phosphotransferase (APT) family kinase protein
LGQPDLPARHRADRATAEYYTPAIDKEDRWLPVLAPLLPVPIPVPVAKGRPGEGYPFPWSIRRWLDGEPASQDNDKPAFAVAVAEFLLALQRIDATGGPVAGARSFYRGAPPAHYDDETRQALSTLDGRIDTRRAAAVWDAALESTWDKPPVWFHGDVAAGNLLVRDGKLAAVIDFGTSGVGDPACDLVIAWTLFSGASREAFRETVRQDAGTWARARGWALWKSLISLDAEPAVNLRIIDDVLTDHDRAG